MISSRNTSDEPVSRQPPWPVSMGARSSATPECGAGVRAGPAATAPELVYPGAGVRSGLPSGPCPGLRGRAAGGPSGGHLGLCRWCAPGRSVGRAGSSACCALRMGRRGQSFSRPGRLIAWTIGDDEPLAARASGLSAFQLEVSQLFFSLMASRGFLLAGGAALLAQHLTSGPTDDLDSLAAPERGHVPAARDELEGAPLQRG